MITFLLKEWCWIRRSWTMYLAAACGLLPYIDEIIPVLPDDFKNAHWFWSAAAAIAVLRVKTKLQKDKDVSAS